MNWTAKARAATTSAVAVARAKPGPVASVAPNANVRASNGLKEFLWLISDIERARVLDLGPVWQSTINFFIERCYRISTEDLLRSWKDFLATEEEHLRQAPVGFHRYRLVDKQTIELLPAPTIAVHARVFQNREILDIFGQFRTSKTFVGRDQVREALFLK